VNQLRYSGNAQEAPSKQAAVIRSMIVDLERTIQILRIEIGTQEERVRVFDKADPFYPILARTLGERLKNLMATVAALGRRLSEIEATTDRAAAEAA
jgi:hypothetical protein